jgi:NADH:ubiquinone oxidoreductase subunit F (NADH-binding)
VSGPAVLDTAWCFDELHSVGTVLGCASVTVLNPQQRLAAVAAELGRWYRAESAEQCGVCTKGTAAIADALSRVADTGVGEIELANLTRWGTALRGRGACAFLDGAANLARTTSDLLGSTSIKTRSDDEGPS